MKIRLSDGDIRLRLSEIEVALILEGREITTAVTDKLAFSLVVADDESSITTVGSSQIVTVPAAVMVSPSLVNPHMYESPPGQLPHILIEMDRQR